MGTSFTNEEFEQADSIEGKMAALISAAYSIGMQSGLAQAETQAMERAREERILELGRIYDAARVLIGEHISTGAD